MRPRLLLLPMLFSLACDADDDAFRNAPISDGDLSIHEGTSAANADCLIWDILGGNVHDAPASGGELGELVLVADDRTISTPDGTTQCTIDRSGALPRLRVGGDDGVAVYTVFQKWVLKGDFTIPPGTGGIAAAAVYTFDGDQVREGLSSGPVIVTATADVQFASPDRKLLIAALLDGTCGAGGL